VQIELIGFYVFGLTRGQRFVLCRCQFYFQPLDDGAGDLVLDLEYVL
jgi:hypothetical protein